MYAQLSVQTKEQEMEGIFVIGIDHNIEEKKH